MSSDGDGRRDWTLYERVAHSMAHRVGNAINVVSGRLKLLELDAGLQSKSLDSVRRAQARLLNLQRELSGVLEFPPDEPRGTGEPLRGLLTRLANEVDLEIRDEVQQPALEPAGPRSELALRHLIAAYRVLASKDAGPWVLGPATPPTPDETSLVIEVDSEAVPADRKALLEPWFSQEAHDLDDDQRHGRLLLAQALSLLVEAGVAFNPAQLPSNRTQLSLSWPRR